MLVSRYSVREMQVLAACECCIDTVGGMPRVRLIAVSDGCCDDAGTVSVCGVR